ncbi:MAG: hypothetical protein DK306_001305 [Chloroflexi bacterium]|jgi:hypothetical protein|nr:MAG: hypothetical protein DK306_001305 [Chloroflexota bacterium]
MPAFPSLEWLQALRDIVNSDPNFRKFGTIDCEMGIEVGERHWKVVFEAFEVADVAASTAAETDELDFVLTQPPDAWREMIENIKTHGAADLHHTLNTLDLEAPENFARGADFYRRDKFYRFNQTLQDFFDASAKLETTFPSEAAGSAP